MDRFPHRRLDVVRLAVELAGLAKGVADGVPRGYRSLAEPLVRSAPAVALLAAEGANRASAAQERQRLVEARGECGEAGATVDVLAALGLVSLEEQRPFVALADRIPATLTA